MRPVSGVGPSPPRRFVVSGSHGPSPRGWGSTTASRRPELPRGISTSPISSSSNPGPRPSRSARSPARRRPGILRRSPGGSSPRRAATRRSPACRLTPQRRGRRAPTSTAKAGPGLRSPSRGLSPSTPIRARSSTAPTTRSDGDGPARPTISTRRSDSIGLPSCSKISRPASPMRSPSRRSIWRSRPTAPDSAPTSP